MSLKQTAKNTKLKKEEFSNELEEKATPVDDDDPRYADDENLDKNKKKKKESVEEESVEEGRKPYPGEYDYTDPKYMDPDGTPKSDDDDDDKKKKKRKS